MKEEKSNDPVVKKLLVRFTEDQWERAERIARLNGMNITILIRMLLKREHNKITCVAAIPGAHPRVPVMCRKLMVRTWVHDAPRTSAGIAFPAGKEYPVCADHQNESAMWQPGHWKEREGWKPEWT